MCPYSPPVPHTESKTPKQSPAEIAVVSLPDVSDNLDASSPINLGQGMERRFPCNPAALNCFRLLQTWVNPKFLDNYESRKLVGNFQFDQERSVQKTVLIASPIAFWEMVMGQVKRSLKTSLSKIPPTKKMSGI